MRSDALPEGMNYVDSGCEDGKIKSCLSCPLEECRYAVEGGIRTLINRGRNRQIIELIDEGIPPREVATRVGTSRRTVFRILAGHRDTRAQVATYLRAGNGMLREKYNAYQREYRRKQRQAVA